MAMEQLTAKRASLKVVVDELDGLKVQLKECQEKAAKLEADSTLCALKLERAEQEKRWQGGDDRMMRDFKCLKDLFTVLAVCCLLFVFFEFFIL